jgi:hypothetical protein
MCGLLGVRAEHSADGDGGHGVFLSIPRIKTVMRAIGSECYEFLSTLGAVELCAAAVMP